jgi:hypothetical protein
MHGFHPFPLLSFLFLSFPFLSFHIISLLTSAGQTGKTISMAEGLNDAFSPKEVPLCGLIEKFDFTGSVTSKNRQNEGVVFGFPAKLGESITTCISVKSRDIDTEFEL